MKIRSLTALPEKIAAILLVALLCVSFLIVPNSQEVFQHRIHVITAVVITCVLPLLARSKLSWLRPYILALVVLSLYTPSGRLGLLIAPGETFDSILNRIDYDIFGFDPSAVVPKFSPFGIELFGFFYAFFIPYIHFSLFLNFVGRNGTAREGFLVGFVLMYTISFLGYLFIPALGPIESPLEHGHSPLEGGFFLNLIKNGVIATGGNLGAFPSLHVGATLYFCLADWDRDRLRSIITIPIVVGIAMATIVLRFHYAIDLIAGGLVALLSWWIARRYALNNGGET